MPAGGGCFALLRSSLARSRYVHPVILSERPPRQVLICVSETGHAYAQCFSASLAAKYCWRSVGNAGLCRKRERDEGGRHPVLNMHATAATPHSPLQNTAISQVYKPVTPGQRGRITTSRAGLWNGRPLRALTKVHSFLYCRPASLLCRPLVEHGAQCCAQGLRKSGGRNNQGRITSYQKGGGARRLYRMVDFKRTIGDQARAA